MLSPRTLRTFGGGAVVAGLTCLLAPWHPLAGCVLVVAGLAALWRADS